MPFSSVSDYKILGSNIIGGRSVFTFGTATNSIGLGNNVAQFGATDSIIIGSGNGSNDPLNNQIIIGQNSAKFSMPSYGTFVIGSNSLIAHKVDDTILIGHDILSMGGGFSEPGGESVVIGHGAVKVKSNGRNNIGPYAAVVIGYNAAQFSSDIANSVLIGAHAISEDIEVNVDSSVIICPAGLNSSNLSGKLISNSVLIGYGVRLSPSANPYSIVAIGSNVIPGDFGIHVGTDNTASEGSSGNVVIGNDNNVGYFDEPGFKNVVIGSISCIRGSQNVVIGHHSGSPGFLGLSEILLNRIVGNNCIFIGANVVTLPSSSGVVNVTDSAFIGYEGTVTNNIENNSCFFSERYKRFYFGSKDSDYQFDGAAIIDGAVRSAVFTVSTLPPASTAGVGARAFVTDSTLSYTGATLGLEVIGGGTNKVPVYSDGSTWRVG